MDLQNKKFTSSAESSSWCGGQAGVGTVLVATNTQANRPRSRCHGGVRADPENLTAHDNEAELIHVRKGGAFVVATMLIAQPLVLFGGNVVFPPDPVGMRLYQEHHLIERVALSIIVCALLFGCLFHLARHKAKRTAPEDAGSYEI